MTSKTLFLILVSSLLLGACDENSSTTGSVPTDKTVDLVDQLTLSVSLAKPRPPSWVGSYLSSRVAQERFDWTRAKAFLSQSRDIRAMQEKSTDNILLKRRLMLLAMGSGDYETALKYAKTLKAEDDPSGLTHLILVLEPLRDGQIITARAIIDTMPKTAIGGYAAPLLRAWLMAGEGQSGAVSSLGSNGPNFYHQVLLADYLNQINLVADPAYLVETQAQMNALTAERLGDIFLRHKKFELAGAMYKIVDSLTPAASQIALKKKAVLDKTIDGLDPQILFTPVPNLRTGIALVFFDMATTFYNDRSDESAQLFSNMALTLDPDLQDARLLLGQIFSRNDRLQSAIDIYTTIPENTPRYKAVQQQIAALQVVLDQDTKAIQTLHTLLDRTKEPVEKARIFLQIGDIERENDSYESAITAYNSALELTSEKPTRDNWDVLYARGMAFERFKKWDQAEKDLTAALQIEPDHPFLLNYLAYSWADQNIHLDQAMDMLLKAVTIAPEDGYITDSVGWVYYRLEKYEQAIKYLERAVELLPYDPTINDHLGDAYARKNRMREARFQWHRALNYSKDDSLKSDIQKKLDKNGV